MGAYKSCGCEANGSSDAVEGRAGLGKLSFAFASYSHAEHQKASRTPSTANDKGLGVCVACLNLLACEECGGGGQIV